MPITLPQVDFIANPFGSTTRGVMATIYTLCVMVGVRQCGLLVDGGGGGGDANFPLSGSHNHGDIHFTVTIVLQRWWLNQDYFN